MFKNIRNYFIFSILCLMFFILSPKAAASTVTKRLMGGDRYQTAVSVSREGWPEGSQYAILATGEDFPDALSAAPLAKRYKAPILLTGKGTLNSDTIQELKRLRARQIFIIGGEGVISANVENQLKNIGMTPIRLAGADRYETSVKVADKVGSGNGIIVTTGLDFADAISAAPIAAQKGMPIILVPGNKLTEALEEYIDSLYYVRTYVINGEGRISTDVINKFPDVKVIEGADKYARNINIINEFSSGIDFATIYAATGSDYPDALAASALAQKSSSPIILLDNSTIPGGARDLIKSKTSGEIIIMGGYGVIDYNTELALRNLPGQISWAYDINDTVYENQGYRFPKTITVLSTSGIMEEVPVTWNLASVDTSRSGTYIYEGEIKGYDRKVILRLVVEPVVTSIADMTADVTLSQLYVFPKTVMANMSDGSVREMSVKWANEIVSINKLGSFTFSGQVEKTGMKASLKLNVVEDALVSGLDSNLEYIIRKKIGKLDYARKIYSSDLLGITTLDVSYGIYDRTLYSISGIENLTNLQELSLIDNYVSDLTPLSGLVNLRSLKLKGNSISNLTPLQNLANLTYLDIRANYVSDVSPLRGLTGLTELYLKDNNVTDYSPLRQFYNNLTGKDFTF